MMASFSLSPVERGVMRCKHIGSFSPEDVRSLAQFFEDYRGKLLIDLTDTTAEECARHLKHLRPMLPTSAVFGAEIDPELLVVPESYYLHEVRYFDSEAEALAWLREQPR